MDKKLAILDRDGIINREIGRYVFRDSDFAYVPGFWEFVERLRDQGYCFAIATNQGGIAKGVYTHEDFQNLMANVEQEFAERNAEYIGTFYAPGHDDICKTLSRKPKSLMLERAMAKANTKPEHAFFIGDSLRDVQAAESAGIRGYRVLPNTNLNDFFDDYQF